MTRCDAFVFGNDHFAALVGDVKTSHFAAQTLSHKFHLGAAVHQTEVVVDEEIGQDGLMVQANRLEQNRDRHFAASIDSEIQDVLRIELEIEPGAAVRNDSR